MKITNRSGFSLIEIIVATAITTVLGVIFLQITLDIYVFMMKDQAMVMINAEVNRVHRALSKAEDCSKKFYGLTFDETNTGEQVMPSSLVTNLNIQFSGTNNVTTNALKIKSTSLQESIASGATGNFQIRKAELIFNFKINSPILNTQELKIRKIPIQLVVDANSNSILSCETSTGETMSLCTFMGGTYDNSKTPTCQLPVFVNNCGSGKVAYGIDPVSGLNCATPTGGAPGGAAVPKPVPQVTQRFMAMKNVMCYTSSCKCPMDYPFQMSPGVPPNSMICAGYAWVPPARSYADVMACISAKQLLPGFNSNCIKMGTEVIKYGFGPCLSCP